MTKRIFRFIFLSALSAAVLASGFIMLTLYQTYDYQLERKLKAEAGYLIHALTRETDEVSYFDGFYPDNRITLIAPDGTVLYDSQADVTTMENHKDRPEVQAAFESGSGEIRRYSTRFLRKPYILRCTPTMAMFCAFPAVRTAFGA